jgi:hypothetical protein
MFFKVGGELGRHKLPASAATFIRFSSPTMSMYQHVMDFLFNYPQPINVALAGNMAAALLFCVISFGMDNTSMFDQYWAMAPVPIAFYYAFNESAAFALSGTRKILVLAAVTIWAVRLFALWFLKDERPDDSGGTPLAFSLLQCVQAEHI